MAAQDAVTSSLRRSSNALTLLTWRSAMTVEYLRPTGPRIISRDYAELGLGLPPDSAPAVLGMLASGFPDADKFLLKQAEFLAKHWSTTRFRFEEKAGADQLNIAIQEPLLKSMADECDAVVIAW